MAAEIRIGDALDELKKMSDESVDCIVTSPPYWGLRDYGVDGQMGLEGTLAEHITALVELFEECRRVLKPHGTLWLNYGDCYATTPNGRSAEDTKAAGDDDRTFRDKPFSTVGPIYGATPDVTKTNGAANGSKRRGGGNLPATGYLKPKDLCMIPNRLAIALQDAGWWVRSEIIWGKPNPMPDSSGNYRPSSAHEKIFLLAKSADAPVYVARDNGEVRFDPDLTERCPLITDPNREGVRWRKMGHFYDASAVRLPPTESSVQRLSQDVENQTGSTRANGGGKTNGNMKAVRKQTINMPDGWDTGSGSHQTIHRKGREKGKTIETNKAPRGHEREHVGLKDRWDKMSRAEQQSDGRLLRNYEPNLDHFIDQIHPEVWEIATAAYSDAHFATFPPSLVIPCIMGGCPKGGTVLDPFGGSGTTGLVAQALQRDAILIELNPDYAEMARLRIARGFNASGRKKTTRDPKDPQTDMFSEAAA